MFRNLRLYRLDHPWDIAADALSTQLAPRAFQPCAPGQRESAGWVAPTGREDAALTREVAGWQLLRARLQERILPAGAIHEVLEERVAERERRREGRLRAAERRELRDEIEAELLPRALLRSSRVWAAVSRRHGLLLVDAVPVSRAERVLGLLRDSLGSLALRPVEFAHPVHATLTGWVRTGELPGGFSLGRWADLQHPVESANKVRFRGQPLDEHEVRAALERGLVVTALELAWELGEGEPLACVLAEDGSLRRLRLAETQAEVGADGSPEARLDADLALAALQLDRFFDVLVPALGGYAQP